MSGKMQDTSKLPAHSHQNTSHFMPILPSSSTLSPGLHIEKDLKVLAVEIITFLVQNISDRRVILFCQKHLTTE